jgi:hypothetical protein
LSHQGTKTQREDEYKLKNGVFSLMSLRLINFNVPRIKKAVTVHGFRGSGLNENLKSLTSKVNERNVTLNGEP